MELYKLSSETLKPIDILDGFESIHWVTRFSRAGEFTIETPYIDKYFRMLPVGTYLGTDLDYSMMYVEKREVRTDDAGVPKLTISGRDATAFLEGRFVVKKYRSGSDEGNFTSDGRVYQVMQDIMNQAYNVNFGLGYSVKYGCVYFYPPEGTGPILKDYDVPRGTVYRAIQELAEAYGVSFIIDRPENDIVGPNYARVRFMPGILRTDRNNPMFSYIRGDFLDEQFTEDITGYADLVSAYCTRDSTAYGTTVYKGDYTHRTLMVDRPESEPKDMIKKAEVDALNGAIGETLKYVDDFSGNTIGEVMVPDVSNAFSNLVGALNKLEVLYYQRTVTLEQAKLYYNASKRTQAYSFEVNPTAGAKYGTDYNLGDIVTVQPSFGDMVDMRVDSFVRSLDKSGYKEYPELVEYNKLADIMELDR